MITCPECSTENLEGMFFCENCGAELSESESSTPLHSEEDEYLVPLGGPTLKLTLSNTGQEILLPEKDEIIIGREDPVSAIFPDIDTTTYGGEEDGVSRKHVKIFRQGDDYFVEDLHSVNSTFINKTKIEPLTPFKLSDGDELMLGRLKLNITSN